MSKNKKNNGSGGDASPQPSANPLAVSDWQDRNKPVYRPFPGPRGVGVPLRVAMERAPYAEVVAHAKDSLDKEVCGVLVGETGEDDEGSYVHVQAIIRGAAAREAGAHVTYTQETWNQIHETMEKEYAKLQIVGWYHTHPGFGVEFSDMDVFIQKNFFSGPAQIGLVTDPLGGTTAICMNRAGGIGYIDRFWVDSREQRCQVPAATSAATSSAPINVASQQAIETLEVRISQLMRTVDDLRNSLYRFLLMLGMVIGTAVVGGIAYNIYSSYSYARPLKPPENIAFIPVPVKIDGKTALIGIGIVNWKIPEELLPKPARADKEEPPEENQE